MARWRHGPGTQESNDVNPKADTCFTWDAASHLPTTYSSVWGGQDSDPPSDPWLTRWHQLAGSGGGEATVMKAPGVEWHVLSLQRWRRQHWKAFTRSESGSSPEDFTYGDILGVGHTHPEDSAGRITAWVPWRDWCFPEMEWRKNENRLCVCVACSLSAEKRRAHFGVGSLLGMSLYPTLHPRDDPWCPLFPFSYLWNLWLG